VGSLGKVVGSSVDDVRAKFFISVIVQSTMLVLGICNEALNVCLLINPHMCSRKSILQSEVLFCTIWSAVRRTESAVVPAQNVRSSLHEFPGLNTSQPRYRTHSSFKSYCIRSTSQNP